MFFIVFLILITCAHAKIDIEYLNIPYEVLDAHVYKKQVFFSSGNVIKKLSYDNSQVIDKYKSNETVYNFDVCKHETFVISNSSKTSCYSPYETYIDNEYKNARKLYKFNDTKKAYVFKDKLYLQFNNHTLNVYSIDIDGSIVLVTSKENVYDFCAEDDVYYILNDNLSIIHAYKASTGATIGVFSRYFSINLLACDDDKICVLDSENDFVCYRNGFSSEEFFHINLDKQVKDIQIYDEIYLFRTNDGKLGILNLENINMVSGALSIMIFSLIITLLAFIWWY